MKACHLEMVSSLSNSLQQVTLSCNVYFSKYVELRTHKVEFARLQGSLRAGD